MKKMVLLLAAAVSMSNIGFADGDMAPVVTAVNEDSPEDKGFYVSLAYSRLSHDIDFEGQSINVELDFNGIMLAAGYKFNPYIAVEGRYNASLGDGDIDNYSNNADVSVWSFFVKPMYPIAPEMDIYVLMGYSYTDTSNRYNLGSFSEGAFSWGAGASYDITEDYAVFAEYTRFYDNTLNNFDHVVDSMNMGLSYKF